MAVGQVIDTDTPNETAREINNFLARHVGTRILAVGPTFVGDPVTGEPYRASMAINLRPDGQPVVPFGYWRALRESYRRVRRDVWHARESKLRATRESYG